MGWGVFLVSPPPLGAMGARPWQVVELAAAQLIIAAAEPRDIWLQISR